MFVVRVVISLQCALKIEHELPCFQLPIQPLVVGWVSLWGIAKDAVVWLRRQRERINNSDFLIGAWLEQVAIIVVVDRYNFLATDARGPLGDLDFDLLRDPQHWHDVQTKL